MGDALGPAIVSRNRISVAQFDALEPFEFRDISARQVVISASGPLLFLLLLSIAVGVAAQRHLKVAGPLE